MNLIQLCQQFCSLEGLPIVQNTTSDSSGVQLRAVMNEVLLDLLEAGLYGRTLVEIQFTTLASLDQGSIFSITQNYMSSIGYTMVENDLGALRIVNDTIYNRTTGQSVFGPLAPHEWQMQLSGLSTGPWNQYRIRGQRFLMTPKPPAGQLLVWEIQSEMLVNDFAGNYAPRFTTDMQICLWPDNILLRGLAWKWRAKKGLDYTQEYKDYQVAVASAISRLGPNRSRLSMNGPMAGIRPGIFVPAGGKQM